MEFQLSPLGPISALGSLIKAPANYFKFALLAALSNLGRLRNPSQLRRPRWHQGRQCTNIQSGPDIGGRSCVKASRS